MTTATTVPATVRDAVDAAKVRVADLHAELPRWGLVVWTAGNVSQRVVVDPAGGPGPDDLLVIKPSGVTYNELTPGAMVVCDLDGTLLEGSGARRRTRPRTPTCTGTCPGWAASCTRTRPMPRRGRPAARRSRACSR
ncbi:hypothetical protein GCM10025864_24110 [Luteimicrobium album]|uniref:Class II aldolase/adducin N-terminal domain-containing protein n=1 Tax=Luteimicrobium album TaxID=1054550 RepID=A0ABQ6I2F1_9MICO|nr:hypothetical protein GCM10025864_24110 [Luteimicrobium album]